MMPPLPIPGVSYGIDHTGRVRAPGGRLVLSGWVAGVATEALWVRLRLGSGSLFNCQAGLSRPDVATIHPGLPGAAVSGFTLDTYISPGLHLGTMEYCQPSYGTWTPFCALSMISETSPLRLQLETPISTPAATGGQSIQGWCFHPQEEIESLAVFFGATTAPLAHGIARPDVGQAHLWCPAAGNSGFAGRLDLVPGRGDIVLVARLRTGTILQECIVRDLVVPDRALESAEREANTARAALIRLPAASNPTVSIIIPIYNQLELTLACLESLVRHAGPESFEVIIIDDQSAPEVSRTLGLVGNLRLYRNDNNRGFILNCNRGAEEAQGAYVLFLNNDTVVTAGWLAAMLAVFTLRPGAGAVGAKLVYPDGTLQEAGGIIWEDGSGHNFGRGDDPGRPEYNYLREADYCSGAALLVPRSVFLKVGGFDTRYCPAYYEDADLAFSIRAAGLKVYFQPLAVVIHYEGASSGTDTRTGAKKHQVINQARFAQKWEAQLAGAGADHSLAHLARDRQTRGRILVIDACALTPDMDAGSVRMFNLLKILARQGCKVTFAAENLQFHEPYSSQLQQEGVEHLGVPATYQLDAYLELNAFAFDVIILSRKHVAQRFLHLLRRCAPRAKLVFDTVDLMFLRFFRQAEVEKSEKIRQEAEASRVVELELCAQSDLVYVVSPDEARILGADIPPEKIAIVPLVHATAPAGPSFAQRQGILFVGGYQHPPNLDAIEYFLDEILPLLARRLPGLTVHIVGSNTPERLQRRASPQILVHGYVAHLDDLLDQVRLSIAPLRYGAGVKGKVNQSMAHGVPVVATTIATEGMHLEDGRNVMVGDTPAAFADALHLIYTDADLWNRVAAAGLENIEQHFSFAAVRQQLMTSLEGLVPDLLTQQRGMPSREAASCPLNEVLHFGQLDTARPFLDSGWSEPAEGFRWATGRKARLRLRFQPDQLPRTMRLVLFPLLVPGRVDRQRVEFDLPGGISPAMVEMSTATPHEFVLQLPATLPEIITVQFGFPDACVPQELGLSGDIRRLSVAFIQLTFS